MSRVFNAPRTLVFDAYTKCEYLKQWLGVFGGWSLDVCKIDLKVGGSYRYEWRNANGPAMGMGGVYREIVTGRAHRRHREVRRSLVRGRGDRHDDLHETDGKTTLTTTVHYASKAARDSVLKSGMAEE